MQEPGVLTDLDLRGDWESWPYGLDSRWPNFSPWEFRSRDDDYFLISTRLLDGLQFVRNLVDTGLYVNQPENGLLLRGFRTREANASIPGSAAFSQHMSGRACDVDARGALTPRELAEVAVQVNCFARGGIKVYRSFVHLDVRPGPVWHVFN